MNLIAEITRFWQAHGLLFLDVMGAVLGIIYIFLEYRASIYLWLISMIMPLTDIFTYYKAGLYADFGMAIYYLLAAVYGWFVWTYGARKNHGKPNPVSSMPASERLIAAPVFLVLWGCMYLLLRFYTNSSVPALDSFANALSIIALWMLSKKYIEQWILWIIVDIALTGLYVYKKIPYHAALYGLYVVMAVFGYFRWKRMMKETENQERQEKWNSSI